MKLSSGDRKKIMQLVWMLAICALLTGVGIWLSNRQETAPPVPRYSAEIHPDSIKPIPLDSVSAKQGEKAKKSRKAKEEKKRNPRPFLDQPIPKK